MLAAVSPSVHGEPWPLRLSAGTGFAGLTNLVCLFDGPIISKNSVERMR